MITDPEEPYCSVCGAVTVPMNIEIRDSPNVTIHAVERRCIICGSLTNQYT
ncbi:Uncharacterised protein [uncultured archaeon]|nr:Uncharacterised protein [uncultured archaeon]